MIRPETGRTYWGCRGDQRAHPIGLRSDFVLKHKPHRRIGRFQLAGDRTADLSEDGYLRGWPDTILLNSKIPDRHQKLPLEKGVFYVEPPVPGGTWLVSLALFRPPKHLVHLFGQKSQPMS